MLEKTLKPLLVFVFLSFLSMPAAMAQEVTGIGIVDVQAVLQQSAAGKNIQSQLDAKRSEYQKQISAKETKLRESEKSILSQKSTLSEAEFAEKRKAFEQDVMAAQKLVQNNKRSLESGFAGGLSKLRDEIKETISSVAKQRGYAMVLSQESVLIAAQSIDITDEVIAALNEKISKIPLDWSTGK